MRRSTELQHRVDDRIAAWRIAVERVTETARSVLVFGDREGRGVVLKVVKGPGDEWRAGAVVDAFEGRGVVRVYDSVDGAMLLERLSPGRSLAEMALSGADEDATGILAATIGAMSPRSPADTVPRVEEWGRAFERYAASGDRRVPGPLLSSAHRSYVELCGSQTRVRLLHGDLHHDNVLLDAERGWLAVDPKGVVGEVEFEVGAALRNPSERPDLFAEPATIRRRVERFVGALDLDATRVMEWAFAQAVLAAVWAVEDGLPREPAGAWIALARALRPMLGGPVDA